jgi:hypothetical protein
MSREYNDYLVAHIKNVQRAHNWICEKMPELGVIPVLYNVMDHDNSKYGYEEYSAYDEYFYGGNRSSEITKEFNYAWLHHIHNNPHHWQYWILIEDSGNEICMEMPVEYVVEMVADWWSFSWREGKMTEVLDWYDDHSKKIMLHFKTKKLVEKILNKIREEFQENDGRTEESNG